VAEESGEGEILDLIVLKHGPNVDPARTTRVPVSAWGKDADGEAIEVVLHVVDGYIAELEFVRYAPGPVKAPPPADTLELSCDDGSPPPRMAGPIPPASTVD
jgi:hypothetical protein